MTSDDPTAAASHFAFGENWQSFLSTVDDRSIAEAERGLRKLFPGGELKDSRFLDVGCGSGLSMLAARRLGAAAVSGVDIDPRSVQATRALLAKWLPEGGWAAQVASVFDLPALSGPPYDIVHSWGVLHHTGDMWTAVARAAALVAPGGRLAIALYRKTPFCGAWRLEKRAYKASGRHVQAAIRVAYQSAYCGALLLTGRNPAQYIRSYRSTRGMSWRHDVHDWLGGYPYESATPQAVRQSLERLGMKVDLEFEKPAAALGLFGSHCDEFVASRHRASPGAGT